MSDYKFDPTDMEDSDEQQAAASPSGDSFGLRDLGGLTMLPFTVIGVYAAVEKAVVLSAVESIIGASGLASAITIGFQISGFLVLGGLGLLGVVGVVSLLLGMGWKSAFHIAISLVVGTMVAVGWLGATYLFSSVPLLVGVYLTLVVAVYGAVMLVAALLAVSTLFTL